MMPGLTTMTDVRNAGSAGAIWRRFEANVRDRGDATALLQGDRSVSFRALRAMALGTAALLAAQGVTPGARCLIWADATPEMAAAMLATWRLGGIIVLINEDAPATHFAHAARSTMATLAVVAPALLAVATAAAVVPVLAMHAGEGPPDDVAPPTGAIADTAPASILFTSGSSGLPKGVTQSHATLFAGCHMVAEHLGLTNDDRILCPVPWAFDYGFGQFLSTVILGVTQVLPVARNPFAVCDAITAHRPTVFAGITSVFAQLLRGLSPVRETDLSSLRLVTNTGGGIPPAIFADMLDLFAHCDISLNYGMTETYRSAGLPVAMAREHPASVGFAYPGVLLAVLRDDGSEAAPDEIGEIVHRGTGVFLGYWNEPERTAAVLRPDPLWPHPEISAPMAVFSGDLGWKDAAGRLFIKGRRDRQIKSMGVRISPDEVEQLIRSTGAVVDVAVVGVPHELLGEQVVAVIVAANAASDPVRALKLFARSAMSKHMQPREYRIVDALPLTPNGKTDFAAVRVLVTTA
jgi:acyl-coenzyme A synthetase/AMP-(fatty) acid ligase